MESEALPDHTSYGLNSTSINLLGFGALQKSEVRSNYTVTYVKQFVLKAFNTSRANQ